jgi:hypothetical protein
MSRRTLDVVDLVELFVHWEAGRSQVQIGESLGLDRKTVRKYLASAVAAGLAPGGAAAGEQVWADRVARWFPEVVDGRLRQLTWPAIEAHRDYIVDQLKDGVTVATISQRLVDERGLSASQSSLRRWIAANLSEVTLRDRASVPRPPAAPGSEAQIDYGKLGMWVDPKTGVRHTIWGFVMVLACSRLMFLRPVIRLDQHHGVKAMSRRSGSSGVSRPGWSRRQSEDRRRPAGSLRSEDQPHLLGAGHPLRGDRRPRSGVQTEGQAESRKGDALRPGLVLAWAHVQQFAGDAGRGVGVVPAGRRRPLTPWSGRRQPAVGVRQHRGASVDTVAAQRVRVDGVVGREGRRRLPRQHRQGPALHGGRGG